MEREEAKVYENELFKVYEVAGKRWDEFLEKFRQTTKKQVELITKVLDIYLNHRTFNTNNNVKYYYRKSCFLKTSKCVFYCVTC